MVDPPEPAADDSPRATETAWQRKRRLAAVFGDVLPETTSDERSDTPPREDATDAWLREQVPPHHGG